MVDGDTLLVGAPFPIALHVPYPSGWRVTDNTSGLVQLSREGSGDPWRTTIFFTSLVQPANDPCNESAGSRLDIESADELAAALAVMPGLDATGPSEVKIGGQRALHVALSPDGASDSCTEGDGWYLWRGPNAHWLVPGELNDLWVVDVEPTVVISVERFAGGSPESLREVDTMVAALDILGPDD